MCDCVFCESRLTFGVWERGKKGGGLGNGSNEGFLGDS